MADAQLTFFDQQTEPADRELSPEEFATLKDRALRYRLWDVLSLIGEVERLRSGLATVREDIAEDIERAALRAPREWVGVQGIAVREGLDQAARIARGES